MKSTAERAKRALSGLTVIVAGVLIALWCDSTWAERQDRTREREILADLLDEFRENEAILVADIDANRRSQAAGRAWAEAMLGDVTVSADSLSSLWGALSGWRRFDPVSGALRSLVDGGELHLIMNQELRRALAGWEDRAEEARITAHYALAGGSALTPMVLTLQPGAEHTAGERIAILQAARASGASTGQLVLLRQHILEIISLLEGQLDS